MGEAKRRKLQREAYEAQRKASEPDLIAACKNAYARQGLAAFEITERATALHEAGHAVAGMAMSGEPPLSLSLGFEDGKFGPALGLCTYREGSRFSCFMDVRVATPEEVIERAAYTIAGQAAEAVLDTKDYRWGSSLDEQFETEAILNGVGHLRLGLSLDNAAALPLLTRVAVTILLNKNRQPVERIATALIARRKLDQAALCDLLTDVVRPEPPVAQFVLAHVQDTITAANGNVRAMLDTIERYFKNTASLSDAVKALSQGRKAPA